MTPKALIVEPSQLFQQVLEQVFADAGVESHVYESAKQVMSAPPQRFDFIIVANKLEDTTAEIFLSRYRFEQGLGEALCILLTADEKNLSAEEVAQAGFQLILQRTHIEDLRDHILASLDQTAMQVEANILLVEDSIATGEQVAALLRAHKARVTLVDNIDAVQQALSTQVYDLVVSDFYLAEHETGNDVIRLIRQQGSGDKSHLPVLVISGETNPEKRVAILRNGANDFILKPFEEDELIVRAVNLIKAYRLYQRAQQQSRQLLKLALTDQLTGLYNRHSLYDLGPKYLSKARRYGTPLSLLVIDLDHFKRINDRHGHDIGDLVLREIAAVLRSQCRLEDIVARFGGEEFVVLLPDCVWEHALDKAEFFRCSIENCQPGDLPVTASVGVAAYQSGLDFDDLFRRADQAVYEAKSQGRNRVVGYSAEPPD